MKAVSMKFLKVMTLKWETNFCCLASSVCTASNKTHCSAAKLENGTQNYESNLQQNESEKMSTAEAGITEET